MERGESMSNTTHSMTQPKKWTKMESFRLRVGVFMTVLCRLKLSYFLATISSKSTKVQFYPTERFFFRMKAPDFF
ncbi:MAG: hypothetical protein EB038_09310 [Cyclobacteriaceae bacterium]|nr:hypothetical protein [Cyclobacteriaceae bacterium]